MKLKNFLIIGVLVGTIITNAIGTTVSAGVDHIVKDQEQERIKHEVSQQPLITEIGEESLSEEDVAIIEDNYRKDLEQRSMMEEELANELANILNDGSLKAKVKSIEKQDKIDAMHVMINAIENAELPEDIQEQIKSYINMYGPYTDNNIIKNYIEKLKASNVK